MKKESKSRAASRALAVVRDERGLSTVEYIIILLLIAVAGIGLWRTFGNSVAAKIGNATTEVDGL